MRITSGEYAGRVLKIPPHDTTRPMAERSRKALFDILTQKSALVSGKSVLDAFSGSGSLGLEALSHKAARVVFVDKSHHAIFCLRRNIKSLGVGDKTLVLKRDLAHCGKPPQNFSSDLFFLSPPWRMNGLYPKSLRQLAEHGWLRPGAMGVIDSDVHLRLELPITFKVTDARKSGDHLLTFVGYPG